MKVVLSNGATLQMPTPALKTRAYLATQVGEVIDQARSFFLMPSAAALKAAETEQQYVRQHCLW